MLVIGIDPGITTTGYGFVRENDDGSLLVVDYGVILTPAQYPMPQRLKILYSDLKEIISLHRNVRTAISVGQARGVALLAIAEADLPVFEYSPTEIKQAVAGYGAADKYQVQQMVQALLELEQIPKPDDAADALAAAICHLHSARLQAIYNQQDE